MSQKAESPPTHVEKHRSAPHPPFQGEREDAPKALFRSRAPSPGREHTASAKLLPIGLTPVKEGPQSLAKLLKNSTSVKWGKQ